MTSRGALGCIMSMVNTSININVSPTHLQQFHGWGGKSKQVEHQTEDNLHNNFACCLQQQLGEWMGGGFP